MPSPLTRTRVATRLAGGVGVGDGVGADVAVIGGRVISGVGVATSAIVGSGDGVARSAATGTE
jgi:hypothetical protein